MSIRRRRLRRGLAPLELAMWIPALLLIAALMLNFGTVVVWRTRGEIASRDVVWRARWSHEAAAEATLRPIWPVDAKLAVVNERPVLELDDPALLHPVVRGPLPNGFAVRDTLDPLRGAMHGEAAVARHFPLLAGKLGPYRTGDIRHSLLDQVWPCRETGNWVNIARRIPVLYQLPTTDASLPQAFVNADTMILSIPHFDDLSVLDHDDEVRRYRGFYPDFHPRIRQICELDPAVIQRSEVNRLVIHTDDRGRRQLGEVARLPRTMTAFYLGMYRGEVARLRAEIERLRDTDPSVVARNEAAIALLLPKIAQLESFQGRISGWERMVLAR